MKLLVNSTLAILLLTMIDATAADLASMQQAALENRALVQRFIANVEKSEREVVLARGPYYPSFDLSYTMNSLDEDGRFEDAENSVAAARVSMNLFAGFRDKYGLASAEELRRVEELRLTTILQDIQLQVALDYLNVYDRLANLKVADDAFRTLEKVYRDGENRYQVGLIGKNELLKFRVDYDNADITVKAAKAGLDKSVNSLGRQIGQPVALTDLDFLDFAELPGELDEEAYEARMLALRSEIRALEGLITAAGHQVEQQKSDYYPQVDAVGSFRQYEDGFVTGSGDAEDDELRAQLVVSLNLFRGFTKEAAVARAKIERRALGYDLRELKADLRTELHNLFIDYRVSLANVAVAQRSIEQAEENLRITQLKYDEGLQRESDLLDAIASLSRAQYNKVAVVRTVFSNYFRLRRMVSGFQH